jgi:hypothetical protein
MYSIQIRQNATIAFSDGSDYNAILQAGTANALKVSDLQISQSATGSTTALLATGNCPATTGTAPYVWMRMYAPDNSVVYVPGWK